MQDISSLVNVLFTAVEMFRYRDDVEMLGAECRGVYVGITSGAEDVSLGVSICILLGCC